MSLTITFQPMGRAVEAEPGETLWSVAHRSQVPLASTCGGQGTCGQCQVRIVQGQADRPTQAESEHLSPDQLAGGLRLACEMRLLGSLVIETPLVHEDKRKILLLEAQGAIDLRPSITKVHIQVPRPSLADHRSDSARLVDTLVGLGYPAPAFGLAALQAVQSAMRRGAFYLSCVFDDLHVIAVEPGDTTASFYGLAIDLGSTTIAGYLVNLRTGERLAATALGNPQTAFGDDVMSRMSYAMANGTDRLQGAVLEVLNDLIQEVCAAAGVEAGSIYALAVTGNTVMLHLLAGLSPVHLGIAPYVAVTSDQVVLAASDLKLAVHPQATIWLLPGAGAYVGADAVSGVLAAGMFMADEVQLLIDFGTNAEIVLGSRRGLWACATASGPAFEGACIRHGMRAAAGAIDQVWIEDGAVHVRTIGGRPALGLAGTGLVSAVAALRRAGLLDERGLFQHRERLGPAWWVPGSEGLELVLQPASGSHPRLTLSQADVGQFQLAKGAVRAAIHILLRKSGLAYADVRNILLAGAFGSFMEPAHALAAGLLPAIPVERVKSLGNAAGIGALMALLSSDMRQRGVEIARAIHYVELSAEPDFSRQFAQALPFERCNLSESMGGETQWTLENASKPS